MIKIEIIDPTIKDEKVLVATARFLMELAGHQMIPAPVEEDKIGRGNGWGDYAINKEEVEKAPEGFVTVEEPLNNITNENPVEYLKRKGKELGFPNPIEKKTKKTKKAIEKFTEEVVKPAAVEEFNKNNQILEKAGVVEGPTPRSTIAVAVPPFGHCAAPVEPKLDFGFIINKITSLVGQEKLTHAQILEAVRKHGVPNTKDLGTHEDKIPAINAEIDLILGVTA